MSLSSCQETNTGSSRGDQTAAECEACDSRHCCLCPEHGNPNQIDFLPSVAECGLRPWHPTDAILRHLKTV
jgi:hypothetical protein